MRPGDSTCWTIIRGAAAGSEEDRRLFAERYLDVVRAYLRARWLGTRQQQDIDDATQEVFLEVFRDNGVLSRATPSGGVFRAFLYGVIRNVALRAESRAARRHAGEPNAGSSGVPTVEDEQRLTQIFDRAWAMSIMQQAAERQRQFADASGPDAQRRVDLLRLRFHQDMPIREIARLWGADPADLHRDYARARREFKEALLETIAFHHAESADGHEAECAQLLGLLQ